MFSNGKYYCGFGDFTAINKKVEDSQAQLAEIEANYTRILKWSDIFDKSPIEVKKMIASTLINRVYVYENYRLAFEFNIDIEQFELGLDEVGIQAVAS